jgi:D-alanyl-D-alanine carboxypeptidase
VAQELEATHTRGWSLRPRVVVAAFGLAAGLVLSLALAAGSPARASAAKPPSTEALQRGLDRLIDVKGAPPGVSVVLRRGKRERFITAGVADGETERPFSPRKHMRIASTSKAFSGAVALSLVDRGVLSLDETIGSRLPTLPPAWGTVTLRELLQHTGGVPSYTKDPDFLAYFGEHLKDTIPHQMLIDFVADQPLDFPPGSSYSYSNTDNIVIALMAEAATSRSYEELLADLVFDPLGLNRTRLPLGFKVPGPLIHGYETNPLEDLTECCSMSFVWASGGLYSTPHELNRFVRAYAGGRLFGDAVRSEQFQFRPEAASEPPGPGQNSAGLALFRYETRCGTVYGHTGNFPGYTQFTAATRSGRKSLTVSANRQLAPDAVGKYAPEVFAKLRREYVRAVCVLLR